MITFKSVKNGAGWKINAIGDASELAQTVTRLFNFGVVSAVPESFESGDKTVTLDTYPARFFGGVRALASDAMMSDGTRHTVRVGKSKWKAIETFRAARIARKILGEKMERWEGGRAAEYAPHSKGRISAEAGE